jgi:dihydroorotase
MKTIIRNASIVNEGKTTIADILIEGERIEKIDPKIELSKNIRFQEINGEGLYLLPGIIDDQVHFREPGLTHKATIYSESKAAVAGGVTSFMDMPNTIPNTLTQKLLEEKYLIASKTSLANYSFFMGIDQNNLEEVLRTDNENVCGITDDGLYFNNEKGILANYPEFLETLFSKTDSLVALHCEDDQIIENNIIKYTKLYGENIPFELHPLIRSEEACITASKRVLEIAEKHNTRLHLLHISTLAEANLFDNKIAVRDKRITAEVCIHHLWFSDKDYERLGAKIKWNPAIKTVNDQIGLLAALLDDKLDIIATDHAPHTLDEKNYNYFKSSSGGPLVQHALNVMLEFFHQGKISIEKIVEKMSHNVAEIYRIKERGYIREGYFADLVLLDLNHEWMVSPENTLYKCQWSPFNNQLFKSSIKKTFVSGNMVYDRGLFNETNKGHRLKFEKFR